MSGTPTVLRPRLSDGAYMSYRPACEVSDLFVAGCAERRAIGISAIVGGTTTSPDLVSCAPTPSR